VPVIGDLRAETVRVEGHEGDEIEAYLARPLGAAPNGGVVVIHHMPGYDEATLEMTRRFAAYGFSAICPNLYSREAPGADPDDAAAAARAAGGVPDDRLVGDVAGAAAYLRSLPASHGRVGVIGFCSGGRQAFLAAVSLDLDAAIDCYGGYVVGGPPAGDPRTPLADRAPDLRCPLLGLFGADDRRPSPAETDVLAQRLRAAGKSFEFQTYEGAGHGFLAPDRPAYRPEAAKDAWRRIRAFCAEHLG
jgi:carboxymethylenebutenolidase